MKKANTLELSVVKISDNEYRALLWYGLMTRREERIVLSVTFTDMNFFKTVRDIKRAVLDWSARGSVKAIHGIHDGAPCWPMWTADSIERALLETERLRENNKLLGFCPVRLPDGSFAGHVYTSGPDFLLKNGEEKIGFPVGTVGNNLFHMSYKVFRMAEEATPSWGVKNIGVLLDGKFCWPESF